MEHETNLPYDYARCDRVWQRVSPELNPYPEAREAVIAPPAPHREECCLASAAEQELENIRAFIEEELEDRRVYLTYARCAPNANARRILRELAAEEGGHARRLMGVYYIITGQCYKPAVNVGRTEQLPWCQALRDRYHAETCGGYHYQHWAQETDDVCLSHILAQFSADEYRHAAALLQLLEGNLLA